MQCHTWALAVQHTMCADHNRALSAQIQSQVQQEIAHLQVAAVAHNSVQLVHTWVGILLRTLGERSVQGALPL